MSIPPFVYPPLGSVLGFVSIVLGVCAALVGATAWATSRRTAARLGAGVLVGLLITAMVSGSGVLTLHPAVLIAYFLTINLVAIRLVWSPIGHALAQATPLWALVGFQSFRLPLELILHRWAQAGTIPPQMTWSGDNLDVVTGILAAVVGGVLWRWDEPLGRWGRALAGGINLIGLGLLLNVMQIAVRSAPGPANTYGPDALLLLVFVVPFGWIVPFCVGGALVGHLLVFRRLWGDRSAPANSNKGPSYSMIQA